ncbi:GNAT family N-acetyltransferase [Vallicoccus soli]|uniref:GNAT family N-acetyltransferase n=1 Tax=Vallicoccus soli TaxID=2339232 RepID=A0A3A3Z1Y5_9ACTN|nr:GNAT family N-acetyltransferase [Vallicoccus soli]
MGVRLVEPADAGTLSRLLVASREHLAPWEPERGPEHLTPAGQEAEVDSALRRHADGTSVPLVITLDGDVVGRITVADVVRGAFQSAHLGYWVAQHVTGRGVATAAVGLAVRLAFEELGLHRLQADTLVHNVASRRVLARNGFERIGLAPRYLRIAGTWQDHVLHQRLHEPDPA